MASMDKLVVYGITKVTNDSLAIVHAHKAADCLSQPLKRTLIDQIIPVVSMLELIRTMPKPDCSRESGSFELETNDVQQSCPAIPLSQAESSIGEHIRVRR